MTEAINRFVGVRARRVPDQHTSSWHLGSPKRASHRFCISKYTRFPLEGIRMWGDARHIKSGDALYSWEKKTKGPPAAEKLKYVRTKQRKT